MSLYIDHKYVAFISPQLERFKRKNQKTYNFRCPICGDSAKSKIKARGYFYVKNNDIFFCCHNCHKNWTLGHFLKEIDQNLYEQYTFEKYKDVKKDHEDFSEFKTTTEFHQIPHDESDSILDSYDCIDKLPSNHFAKEYLIKRKIPEFFWRSIFFIPDFKQLVNKIEPENEYGFKEQDPRLVIPFYNKENKLIAFQGRSFNKTGMRYITIKVDKEAPKIYGLDRVNLDKCVYVVEGPFDSMFLSNAIATAGSNLASKELEFKDSVFIFDNEKRSKEIVKQMEKVINEGRKICIWPDTIQEKDINNMVLAGRNPEQIIENNTYQGLNANIALADWKRC